MYGCVLSQFRISRTSGSDTPTYDLSVTAGYINSNRDDPNDEYERTIFGQSWTNISVTEQTLAIPTTSGFQGVITNGVPNGFVNM